MFIQHCNGQSCYLKTSVLARCFHKFQKQLNLKIYSSTSFIQRNPHIGQITNGDTGEVNI
ncbi:hypothetical protein T12_8129 [Trichinella patagoniensis]|uniref:Uncharacterized protein n=1 Tax=Trichinella patagoniensis TaxID=990121 RepID=A0A0V0ZUF2_9BILA|nr:hypothetical protein T12_8129 [Trichinella patagoniensis]